MTDILDDLSTHMENVRQQVFPLYEQSDLLAGLIKKSSEAEPISRYLYRIPFKKFPGGAFAKFTMNLGTLGIGHTAGYKHLTAGYFPARLAFRMTLEQLKVTDGGRKSVINNFNETIREAIPTMQVMDDISLHTDGTGKLTNQSSAQPSTSSLTFAGVTDTLGINRLREGLSVDVWNAAGSTKRAIATGRPLLIDTIDYDNKIVTFNQVVTALASTDIITFEGLDSFGPSTLVSFTAGWPTAPESQVAGGLGGDSFRHGIYYSNDNTPANHYLGILKSTLPQLLPNHIAGQSDALNFAHGYELISKLIRRRDGNRNSITGLVGIAEMKQRRQVQEIGVSIANKYITGDKFGRSTDLWPENLSYADTFDYCGITSYVDKRQFEDRFDFINPSKWFRAEAVPMDWLDVGGKRFFEARSSVASEQGEVAAGMDFFLYNAMDFGTLDPGSEGYIDGLAVPTI